MPDLNVGGQAVIEGVMMRSEDKVATAVRIPSGEILVKADPYRSLAKRYKILGLPILRGAVAFTEMLVIGIRTLNFSADVAVKEFEKEEAAKNGEKLPERKEKRNSLYLALTAILAIVVGMGVFFAVPIAVANLFGIEKEALEFNLLAGSIRLVMFVAYVWVISFLGEFKRIFQYHGAEHKSIYAFEMGDELSVDKVRRHTRFHPRCGTSFILIVAMASILIYAMVDTAYSLWVGTYSSDYWVGLVQRLSIHLPLLPLVAGSSFELLKLSGKTRDNAITRILIQPGLWLQRITTKEPTDQQLEVGIAALKAAVGITESRISSQRTAVG